MYSTLINLPSHFRNDASNISYIIALLCDRAFRWAEALVDKYDIEVSNIIIFWNFLSLNYFPVKSEEKTAEKLWSFKQGN